MRRFKIFWLILVLVMLFSACESGIKYDSVVKGDDYTVSTLCNGEYVLTEEGDEDKLVSWFFYMPYIQSETDEGDEKTGDSFLIKSPDGKYMIVDSGLKEGTESVIKEIKQMGIEKIDACMVSHYHVDHIEGMPTLIETFDIDTIYMAEVKHSNKYKKALLKTVADRGMEVVYVKDGDSFKFGEKVDVDIYNPDEIAYPSDGSKLSTAGVNNTSIVAKFTYNDSSMIILGDLYVRGETEVIVRHGDDLKADIIKVGHHGSKTSSSDALLEKINPIIACTLHNQVADNLIKSKYDKRCVKALHSALDGTYKVRCDGSRNYECFTTNKGSKD